MSPFVLTFSFISPFFSRREREKRKNNTNVIQKVKNCDSSSAHTLKPPTYRVVRGG